MEDDEEDEEEAVRHFTTSCSPNAPGRRGEKCTGWLTMRSDRISRRRLPTMGTRFHAIGDVQRAAM